MISYSGGPPLTSICAVQSSGSGKETKLLKSSGESVVIVETLVIVAENAGRATAGSAKPMKKLHFRMIACYNISTGDEKGRGDEPKGRRTATT